MPHSQSPFSREELEELRSSFPYLGGERIYLNHAAISPLPSAVAAAIQRRTEHRSGGGIDIFERDAATSEMARKYLANMINAPSEERIAFVGNTSDGLNLIAGGLEWEEGDHILICDQEFPSNVYPYTRLKKHGVQVEKAATTNGGITAEQISRYIRPETRLVAVSAVQFLSGYRSDLEAIGQLCNEHDCWFVVDGIQALGAVSVDVQHYNIDALAAGSHKWLMGPQGIGYLYLTEALQEAIVEHPVGWLSVKEPWHLFQTEQELDGSARRYELGTPNANGIYGLHATLERYHQIGSAPISQQIRHLTDLILQEVKDWEQLELLTPVSWDRRAGIVTLKLPEDIDQQHLMGTLKQQKVTLALRENALRFSPHYYNTEDEVRRALELVQSLIET